MTRPPRLRADILLHDTADGHKWLSFGRLQPWSALRLAWFLRVTEGFKREGRHVQGAGEWIAPDYVRDTLRLEAGGDDTFGTSLIAVDEAGSLYLEALYRAFAQQQPRTAAH